jgi:hypothetical protein
MAHVAAGRFAGKTQKVKLLLDQKIRGVALSKGDTCDIPVDEALYLSKISRVEFVTSAKEEPAAGEKVTR